MTVDQMDPFNEIWMAGSVIGRVKGWIQIFQVGQRRGRVKVMTARSMKEQSKSESMVMMCLKMDLISTAGERRTKVVTMFPARPNNPTTGSRRPSTRKRRSFCEIIFPQLPGTEKSLLRIRLGWISEMVFVIKTIIEQD